MKVKLLLVVNTADFFLSHRLAIAEEARRLGYHVRIATMPGEAVQQIRDLGFQHSAIPLSRSAKDVFGEVRAIFSIWWLLCRVKPDVLHLVTIKPVLYGGIAARLAPVKGVVAAISGLGFVFISRGLKATILRRLVRSLYRLALGKKNLRVIFQNPDDRDALIRMGVLEADKAEMIRGSGVDLSLYLSTKEAAGPLKVCLAARLLRDKGIVEFVEAANILQRRGLDVRFQLAGDSDPGNPATITRDELGKWRNEGVVEMLGHRNDIAQLFAAAHIVVLPSYYGEGLPKVLVEAAACGRAVVTTDHPGCRDAIEPNVSGLLVPVRDPGALADAIEKLIKEPELRQQMGRAGRALAEREFSIETIASQHLAIYKQLEALA